MTKPQPDPQVSGANRQQGIIAIFTLVAIAVHLLLRFGIRTPSTLQGIPLAVVPLLLCLVFGGGPLILELLGKLVRREFGADLLAGISILTSVLLGEYLAGSLVVLMLSGGEALEAYAVRSASSVLEALAKRMPLRAHRKQEGSLADIPLDEVGIGDELVVLPHEICPVDGLVLEGHGTMDESFLTGEPYLMSKLPGSTVISGAINGDMALTIRAEKRAEDSRYARIMRVMRGSEQRRPKLRRLGDQLGAIYTPLAVAIALAAWGVSGDPIRFLAVLVVATPCPLLIAIPVAIIGAISLAARRGIVIKDPAVLETIDGCRTAIFDKTGTLTYGRPKLTEVIPRPGLEADEVLALVASLERYSKHPLAGAILEGARAARVTLRDVNQIQERPGEGLLGILDGQRIQITGRKKLVAQQPQVDRELPAIAGGLECICLIDDRYAATLRFRDEPRAGGASFIHHLGPRHQFDRVMLVTGDRESEAHYLAEQVGINEVFANQTPEQKLEIVRRETQRANTVFLGDGINDAPALTAATVGIALGRNSDITAEAAGAVILDSSLQKIDEFLHISRRLRTIALQSAIGGMTLSLIGMAVAAAGYLPPVAGAIGQEMIDVLAVANALRMAIRPKSLTDYDPRPTDPERLDPRTSMLEVPVGSV
ncbi:heavy metal-(Cd/Co/Hg/Pb/Zn)-translocating P-type ATPase [Singulisphaera sp. GP187]|uniref:heavy metal translocating P-type ATPase n=1 Tax=Singulisphaera sp. GP187 TaxID=1882752 RepID=UPI000925AC80|nr:heavy metal translocating P-type ATPase [Singulisphaera sp. GP187]SIO61336.1 heavy metal-(Cd/Co/Hg/Pb/Zn)-translocating P-type ATPase [Singulisphaera sp. GP187]